MPDEGYVMWLKLPDYTIPWMISRYGFPCVFPSATELAGVLRRGLIANKGRAKLHVCCLTADMFNSNTLSLSEDDRLSYIPIALPERIMRKGQLLRTTDKWQLTAKATIELREHIRFLFWCDLAAYINDTTYHAVCNGIHITLDRQICDWMDLHDIDISFMDTIVRQYHRDQTNGEAEIRERLEKYHYDLRTTQSRVLRALAERQRSSKGQYTELRRRMAERSARKTL